MLFRSAERYREAGADFVIDSICEIPAVIAEINHRMEEAQA